MSVTLREWGETWLARREREGMRSIESLRCLWRCHVLEAPFVDRPLGEIRRSDVRAFVAARTSRAARHRRLAPGLTYETVETEHPLSHTTVRRVASALHAVFEAALDEELLMANPASRLRLRLVAATEPSWTFLDAGEIARIEQSPDLPAEQRSIYLTAIYTGARRGELWGLRWSDVHLDADPHIVIARSYDGPTKSGRIGRVPLIPRAREVLARWSDATPAVPYAGRT